MGRLTDFVVLIVAIFGFFVVQMSGGIILDELRGDLLETEIQNEYNAEENMNGMFTAVTKWVPLTGLLGIVGLIGYREYRRQRVAAQTRGLR
jgi:hypothetical protein